MSRVHLPGASEAGKSESESGLEEVTAGNALNLVKDTSLYITARCANSKRDKSKTKAHRTFLGVQRLRVHLPVQETQVQALVQEDPHRPQSN